MSGGARGALLSDFADFSLRVGATTLLPGRLYIPPAAVADPSAPRPLILFLHGAGESGVNNAAQVNGNIDNLLAEAKRREAFLYAPQTNSGWSSSTILAGINAMLDRALAEQPVDARRVYVTGLSMGGGGTWNMLDQYGQRFAAAVPICAVAPTSGFQPARLAGEPIWAFHAANDSVVSYFTTRNVVSAILNAAGEPLPSYPSRPTADFAYSSPALELRHTEYRTGGHGIWGRVYSTPEVYEWMFAHTTVPEPTGLVVALMGLAALRLRAKPHSESRLA
ncbi:MAG: dienelactone hydrolase family protein [Pirellulales bacterium]|nr:dienelactone hydrolase family protein [Pirellulales bacterium]